jgi:hypothetical protein
MCRKMGSTNKNRKIGDMSKEENFKDLKNLIELSLKLVETRRHIVHDVVYSLFKLVLLPPVATTSVEIVFLQ